ncbi:sodium/hydrogen exchanger 2-like [Amaranthus tricolor]|uniref:sodium/hydrogen exchanger 2-like n=1 Tax=Amaranthus tricolor TaxID=29722 RepID=UPI00259082A2|nr:sodium/hydrogen exchanger 2-like [Amaranthus tricolor]
MFGLPNILHESTFDGSTVISITVFVSLICLCIIVGHLLEENRWANESITSLLLGLVSGGIVLLIRKGQNSRILEFNEELFFIYLLPPIIFNAGFQVKKKQFFKNFATILSFGVLGTIISFCLISAGVLFLLRKIGLTQLSINDFLALGAIFSATDSVCTLQVLNQDETPLLYSVVFGEGVVNDATSIVLFNAVQSLDLSKLSSMTALALLGTFFYLFLTSTLLGVIVGLLSALIIKKLYIGRHSTDREIALMMLMAYLSYMIAELMSLSGILTVFFCGIVMSHYTWHNVSESSRITSKHAFATISFISETFIFLYVGMDTLDIDKWKQSSTSAGTYIAVSSSMLALVMIGRAAFVFLLSNILNYNRKNSDIKIGFSRQFIIWWAGLMRGAVTVALSYNAFSSGSGVPVSSERALMISCTLIVVLFSTLLFGTITKPLIKAVLGGPGHAVSDATDIPSLEYLEIPFLEIPDPDQKGDDDPQRQRRGFSLLMKYPTGAAHHLWRKFDDKFMRPVFGGRGFVTYEPASPTGVADPNPNPEH